jgi:hypothetical protein
MLVRASAAGAGTVAECLGAGGGFQREVLKNEDILGLVGAKDHKKVEEIGLVQRPSGIRGMACPLEES